MLNTYTLAYNYVIYIDICFPLYYSAKQSIYGPSEMHEIDLRNHLKMQRTMR